MIDEKEIMPFNFFKYGGVYSGEHQGMRYVIKRAGEKPSFILTAAVWQGPYCYAATPAGKLTQEEFSYDEDGRSKAIEWLKEQYKTRLDEWENAPSVLEADISLSYDTAKNEDSKGDNNG